eukprot:TRINITY_DN111197_c0_g1_i1.p2 TRINITY_DN111197_c0_g1~~TRINITY_DN111197_c0_g1_i1.p2  ORF type:complete len:214 (-),score=30.46 TRINITY_DN111197_c0_g1_i1:47-688(-)
MAGSVCPEGFKQGDRVVVQVHRHNPHCHEESYKVGEHGVVTHAPEMSSTVTVRLDGQNGKQGNYFRVETVQPSFNIPVRHRFVVASILHLKRLPEIMVNDYAVFQTEPGNPDGGHFLGRVAALLPEEDEQPEGQGQLFTVQPLQIAGPDYGPPAIRPWAKVGRPCQRRERACCCRVYLEQGMYLRDISQEEIFRLGLAQDLGLELAPKALMAG